MEENVEDDRTAASGAGNPVDRLRAVMRPASVLAVAVALALGVLT
ncbi:hypothetical protein AB0P07_06770 [Streptomyces sp. NPDC085944]